MSRSYLEALKVAGRVRADEGGVISFEYVMVAACIVGATAAVLGGAGAGTLQGALTAGVAAISNAIAAV
jgi:hypothetical protein